MRSIALFLIACTLVACDTKPDGIVLIAAYGDSTQRDQGITHAATRDGWVIENMGVGSSTTAQWLARWEDEIKKTKAQIVIYNGGLNDSGMSLPRYKAALREMEKIARSHGKRFVLEQPNNAIDQPNFDLPGFNERRAAAPAIAASIGAHYCEQPPVPLKDSAHPTADGYSLKAERLAKCLEDILE